MKTLIIGILVLAFATPWASPSYASSGSSALLHVRATIRPWIKFSATQNTSSYQVTEEDIRRGFIDLPRALTINVQTNIREAIRFDIASGGPERVLIHQEGGLAEAVQMKGQSPTIPATRTLDMRVVLPDGVQEGTYPVMVAVAPVAY